MKNYKKITTIAITAIFLLGFLIIANVFAEDPFAKLGKLIKENNKVQANNITDKVIVNVNGHEITKKQVMAYKNSYEVFHIKLTENEIIKKIAKELILLDEASKYNISINDKIVDEQINLQMNNLKNNAKTYNDFKNFIDSAGITEEEYIELVRPIYKRLLIIGTFKRKILEPRFKKENPDLPCEKFNNAFEKYYSDYKEGLFRSATIKYYR